MIMLFIIFLIILFCIIAIGYLLIFHKSSSDMYEINVWVFTKDDKLIQVKLKVDENDKVESIKEKIQLETGIPPKYQSLSSLGIALDGYRTFKHYNIKKGAIIDDITNY